MISSSFWRLRWPRFTLYPPLIMGMIQPEWLYLYQLLNETREEEFRRNRPTASPVKPGLPAPAIRIHLRARPESKTSM